MIKKFIFSSLVFFSVSFLISSAGMAAKCEPGTEINPAQAASQFKAGCSLESAVVDLNCGETIRSKAIGEGYIEVAGSAAAGGIPNFCKPKGSISCKCDRAVYNASYDDVESGGTPCELVQEKKWIAVNEVCPAPVAQAASSGECPELTAFRNKAASCKTKSASAVSQCSPDNAGKNSNNDSISTVQGLLGKAGQISQAMGQKNASGAQSCFQAAAIASGGWQALDLMKTDCASEISSCTSECDGADQMYAGVYEACYNKFAIKTTETLSGGLANVGASVNEAIQTANQNYANQLHNQMSDIRTELNAGKQACSIDAKSNQANLGKLAKDMSSSAQQAAKCECQLTAGQTNCDQIQGPEYCNQNPGDPNCPKAITMKCSGADANTKECICLRDPKGTACLGNTAGVSQIAGGTGANFNPLTGGGVNFKPSGAGVTGGLDGLNDLSSSSGTSGDKSAGGPELPGGVASGGGGGGAGGGGGPEGLSPEGAPAEGESKSLAGGLFNYAKTVASQLFGGGSAGPRTSVPSKNFGSKAARPGIDPNKWRPVGLRGVAGSDGSGFGGKSMNIFDMVNNQYNNQYHTLMIAPVQ